MRPRGLHHGVLALATSALASVAAAGVTTFSGEYNPAPWLAAAGPNVTTVTFNGLADGTVITNQFMDLGVDFAQAGTVTSSPELGSFVATPTGPNWTWTGPQPTDGMRGSFAAPQRAIAFNMFSVSQGNVVITLYSGGQTIWSGTVGPCYSESIDFPWGFVGLVSDQAFDGVWITAAPFQPDWPTSVPATALYIKDLSFSPVPTPGALPALVLAAFARGSRRRA
jgi:hypothetical protein